VCQTYDQEVVSSTPSRVTIEWLLHSLQTDRPSRQITKVNSAFYTSGVGKSSTDLPG